MHLTLSLPLLLSYIFILFSTFAKSQNIDKTNNNNNTVLSVSCGGFHSCALLQTAGSKGVKCWGYNSFGQLGYGDTRARGANEEKLVLPYVDISSTSFVNTLRLGTMHTCAMLDSGGLKCWGFNFYGQLGLGDTKHRGEKADEMGSNLPEINLGSNRFAISLAVGSYHTCALLDTKILVCFGRNNFGQLGHGDVEAKGGKPNEMGDYLIPVNLGTNIEIKNIYASSVSMHNCVLFTNMKAKCWGSGDYGRLGYGDEKDRGGKVSDLGDRLPFISFGTNVTVSDIYPGVFHNCVTVNDNSTRCFGRNNYGQLGIGSTKDVGDDPKEMGDSLVPTTFGPNLYAVYMTLGRDHSCALLSNNTVKCYGFNGQGQLGSGNTLTSGSEANPGDRLPSINLGIPQGSKITQLATGRAHNCVVIDAKIVRCWGYNGTGQLGVGDETNRGRKAEEMGENLKSIDMFANWE